MIRPIRIAKDHGFFHVWEKWYVQSEVTEVCEFRAKIPAFYRRLQLADIQRGKFFSKSFSRKKVKKHLGNWSGIVSCISLSMKTIVKSQLNNSGRGKTERDVSLSCAFYRSYFLFHLLFKSAILLKFIHFQLCVKNKKLTLLVILWLPHILTLINNINKHFY